MSETAFKNFRLKYPQYNDLNDLQIIDGFRRKYPQYDDLKNDDIIARLEHKYTPKLDDPTKVYGDTYKPMPVGDRATQLREAMERPKRMVENSQENSNNTQWWEKPEYQREVLAKKRGIPSTFVGPIDRPTETVGEALGEEWTGKKLENKIPLFGGVTGMVESGEIVKAAIRLKQYKEGRYKYTKDRQLKFDTDGQPYFEDAPIRENDEKLVSEYIAKTEESGQQPKSIKSKIAHSASALPTFMAELMLTGGTSTAVRTGIEKKLLGEGTEKVAKKSAKATVRKLAVKGLSETAGAGVQAATSLSSRTLENIANRRRDVETGLQKPESWATSFLKGFGDQTIELASERAGETITMPLNKLINNTKLGKKLVGELSKRWAKKTGNKASDFINKVMAKGQYSSFIGEFGEEELGRLLRAVTGVTGDGNIKERLMQAYDDWIEEAKVQAGTLAIPGIIKAAATYGTKDKQQDFQPETSSEDRGKVRRGMQSLSRAERRVKESYDYETIVQKATGLTPEQLRNAPKKAQQEIHDLIDEQLEQDAGVRAINDFLEEEIAQEKSIRESGELADKAIERIDKRKGRYTGQNKIIRDKQQIITDEINKIMKRAEQPKKPYSEPVIIGEKPKKQKVDLQPKPKTGKIEVQQTTTNKKTEFYRTELKRDDLPQATRKRYERSLKNLESKDASTVRSNERQILPGEPKKTPKRTTITKKEVTTKSKGKSGADLLGKDRSVTQTPLTISKKEKEQEKLVTSQKINKIKQKQPTPKKEAWEMTRDEYDNQVEAANKYLDEDDKYYFQRKDKNVRLIYDWNKDIIPNEREHYFRGIKTENIKDVTNLSYVSIEDELPQPVLDEFYEDYENLNDDSVDEDEYIKNRTKQWIDDSGLPYKYDEKSNKLVADGVNAIDSLGATRNLDAASDANYIVEFLGEKKGSNLFDDGDIVKPKEIIRIYKIDDNKDYPDLQPKKELKKPEKPKEVKAEKVETPKELKPKSGVRYTEGTPVNKPQTEKEWYEFYKGALATDKLAQGTQSTQVPRLSERTRKQYEKKVAEYETKQKSLTKPQPKPEPKQEKAGEGRQTIEFTDKDQKTRIGEYVRTIKSGKKKGHIVVKYQGVNKTIEPGKVKKADISPSIAPVIAQTQPTNEKKHNDIVARIKSIQKRAKRAVPTYVVQTVDELPDNLKNMVLNKYDRNQLSKYNGLHARDSNGNGIVIIFTKNQPTVEHAAIAWFHEQVGHNGIHALYDNEFESMLDFVIRKVGIDEIKRVVHERGYKSADDYTLAKEYLAFIAEKISYKQELTNIEQNIWDKFIQWLSDVLGMRSASGVEELVLRSYRYIFDIETVPIGSKVAGNFDTENVDISLSTIDESGTPRRVVNRVREGKSLLPFGTQGAVKGTVKAKLLKQVKQIGEDRFNQYVEARGFKVESLSPIQVQILINDMSRDVPAKVVKNRVDFTKKDLTKPIEPDELPKYAGSVNQRRQNISDSAKSIQTILAQEHIKTKIPHSVLLDRATKVLDQFVKNPDFYARRIRDIRKGKIPSIEEVVALRLINAYDMQVFADTAKKVSDGIEPVETLELMQQNIEQNFYNVVNPVSADAGRRLSSFNIVVSEMQVMRAIAKQVNKKGRLNERQIELVKNLDFTNAIQVSQTLRKFADPTFFEYVHQFWYNSILSGIPTHIVNATSNTLWLTWQIPHRLAQGGLNKFFVTLHPTQRRVFMREIVPMFAGFKSGFVKGAKGAAQVVVKGELADPSTKWELELGRAAMSAFERSPYKVLRAIAPFISVPTRALAAMDVWAKSIAFDAEMNALAYRSARQKGLKPGTVEFNKHIRKILEKPSETMMDTAQKFAQYATFMDDPGKITKIFLQARRYDPFEGTTLEGMQLVRLFLPFIATPANLLKRGLEMTPGVGLLMSKGMSKEQVIAKQMEGAMFALVGAYLIANGLLTGPAPREKNKKERFYAQGKQAWSIKIGNKWISYRRFEPFNLPISSIAVGWDAVKRAKTEDEAMDRWMFMINAYFLHVIDSSYLANISDLFDRNRGLTSVAKRTIGSFVPYSSFWRSMNRAVEVWTEGSAKYREKGSILDGLRETTIPGLLDLNEPRINIWGEEIEFQGGAFRQWLPYKWGDIVDDPLEKEFERLGIAPGLPGRNITVRGNKVKLDDTTYRNYAMITGKHAKQRLLKLVKTERYKNKNDEMKKELLSSMFDAVREKELYELKKRLRSNQ